MNEITLQQWAARRKVPYRTALEWARTRRIPAEKKRAKVVVRQVKTVTRYMIAPRTTLPA